MPSSILKHTSLSYAGLLYIDMSEMLILYLECLKSRHFVHTLLCNKTLRTALDLIVNLSTLTAAFQLICRLFLD